MQQHRRFISRFVGAFLAKRGGLTFPFHEINRSIKPFLRDEFLLPSLKLVLGRGRGG